MKAILTAVVLLGAVLAGCNDTNCKNGCDKLTSCGLKSSGFSCDENCKEPQDECAACINDTACDKIQADCAAECPGVSFTKQ